MENNHNNKNMSKGIVRNKSKNFKKFLESKEKDLFLRKLKVRENKLYNSEITKHKKFIVHKNKLEILKSKLSKLKIEKRPLFYLINKVGFGQKKNNEDFILSENIEMMRRSN